MPAATSAFTGKGLLGSRPAPIYEINPASTGAGYFSKELINKIMVGFKRLGRTVTDLYISPEDSMKQYFKNSINGVENTVVSRTHVSG